MTETEFQKNLKEALQMRFDDIPDPEELYYDYVFSSKFKRRMKRMIQDFDYIRNRAKEEAEKAILNDKKVFTPEEDKSYSLNRHTLKKALTIALIAALLMALAACAAHFAITWHETNNEKQGTLDVTFELENAETAERKFEYKKPQTPKGFNIVAENKENQIYTIEYQNEDEQIVFSQSGGIENAGVSIDNDKDSFAEIMINGYKGYCVKEANYNFIVWTDGISFFSITSNSAFETILSLAESVK